MSSITKADMRDLELIGQADRKFLSSSFNWWWGCHVQYYGEDRNYSPWINMLQTREFGWKKSMERFLGIISQYYSVKVCRRKNCLRKQLTIPNLVRIDEFTVEFISVHVNKRDEHTLTTHVHLFRPFGWIYTLKNGYRLQSPNTDWHQSLITLREIPSLYGKELGLPELFEYVAEIQDAIKSCRRFNGQRIPIPQCMSRVLAFKVWF